MTVANEVDENFKQFQERWWDSTQLAKTDGAENEKFVKAFRLLAALNGVRVNLTSNAGDKEFLLEAQNDALASLVLCQMGLYRASLQSLRSFIESYYNSQFFRDHPVELEKWRNGSYRTGFSELTKYFTSHPSIDKYRSVISAVETLSEEYATLSKAVHGSVQSMWMSSQGQVSLAGYDPAKVGSWNTRFLKTIRASLVISVALYKGQLSGTKQLPLKSTIGLVLTAAQRTKLKDEMAVSLPNL